MSNPVFASLPVSYIQTVFLIRNHMTVLLVYKDIVISPLSLCSLESLDALDLMVPLLFLDDLAHPAVLGSRAIQGHPGVLRMK